MKIDLTGSRRGKSVVIAMAAMLEDYGKRGTPLSIRMRELAATGHPRAAELYARAQELDTATMDKTTPIPLLVAYWARARRLWCDLTGDDLA